MFSRFYSTRAGPFVRSGRPTILSRPPPLPTPRIVQPADHADLSTCIEALSSAFEQVPCTNSFSIESGQSVREYVDKTVRASLRSHGALVEAGSVSAVALWELPYRRSEIPSLVSPGEQEDTHSPLGSIKGEWKEVVAKAKRKYIGLDTNKNDATSPMQGSTLRPHYHLDFVGRNPKVPKVAGAVSAVIRPFLGRAEQDHLSVWLEATSTDVIPLYEYFGFRVVEEITVGVGRVDADGRIKAGGPGVKAWLMLIENHQDA